MELTHFEDSATVVVFPKNYNLKGVSLIDNRFTPNQIVVELQTKSYLMHEMKFRNKHEILKRLLNLFS